MGGNRKPETTTTETEDNTELLARQECSRLARQLRLMENDKRAYWEESNAAIYQQKKTIQALEEENIKIQKEIDTHKSKRSSSAEERNLKKILELVDQCLFLEKEVEEQTKISIAMGKQLSLAETRLEKLKVRVEMVNDESRDSKWNELTCADLDTKEFAAKKKLETVTAQFDAVVAENAEMRKSIDNTVKENVRVMKRCQEYEKISMNNRAEIDDLVDQATNAYDQREEAVAKANALFERNEKEKKQFIMEISELNRIIRHEEKLLDFMGTKNQDRTFLETDNERLSRLESAKEQNLDDALESYRENLNKLLTKESPTLPTLVEEYANLWRDNINRFQYINELNNEIEILQADTESLRDETKRCALETVERNQQKTAEITKQQDELVRMKEDFSRIQTFVDSYKVYMDEIVRLIERMFYITDFEDAKPVLELIGNQQEISSQNSILYLNILESRITEIFMAFKRGGTGSGRASPRSPRPHAKSVSDISVSSIPPSRPRIVIGRSETIDNAPDNSEDEGMTSTTSIVEEEPSPLEYFAMRGKLLDSISIKSASDTDSVFLDPPNNPNAPLD